MKKSQKKALAVGAGVAAVAAAATGAYLFGGKRGAKNRAKVAKWAANAKKDVEKEVGKITTKSKAAYSNAVDKVLKQYENLKEVDKSELLAVAKELKEQWDTASTRIQKAA